MTHLSSIAARRESHSALLQQFILPVGAATAVILGIALAIGATTQASVRAQRDVVSSAVGELAGIRYLRRAQNVANALSDYQLGDERQRIRSAAYVAAAIAAIPANILPAGERSSRSLGSSSNRLPELDAAVRARTAAALRRWGGDFPRDSDIKAVEDQLATLQQGIFDDSGIANDRSIDGINVGDALMRIPLVLADANAATASAQQAILSRDVRLDRRIAAARLLAQAETALDICRKDLTDERVVNADLATPLSIGARTAQTDLADLDRLVTAYTVAAGNPDHATALAIVQADQVFRKSGQQLFDKLAASLERITRLRMVEADLDIQRHQDLAIGGLLIDLLLLFILVLVARSRYNAERKRIEAERLALEAQLTRTESQQALEAAQAQFQAIFDHTPIGMILLNTAGDVISGNDAANALFARLGITDVNVVLVDYADQLAGILRGDADQFETETIFVDPGGHSHWLSLTLSTVGGSSAGPVNAIAMIDDISERKLLDARLEYEASHDQLTGLPSRNLFISTLEKTISEMTEYTPHFSVIFIDFNGFKLINDTYGHLVGDHFLKTCARRLRENVRAYDVVARLGGDEFAVLLFDPDRARRASIEDAIIRLQKIVSVPIVVGDITIETSASFGVVYGSSLYSHADEMLRDADIAMYQSKAAGGKSHVIFDSAMREANTRRTQLAADLAHAIDRNELELHYQPIVELETGHVVGCEALVRWRGADGKLLPAAEFIQIAEESGLIVSIGRWVIATACAQLQEWNAVSDLPRMTIQIHLAVPEIHYQDLLAFLTQTLARTGVDHDQVVIEVTETLLLKNAPQTRSTLTALSAAGHRVCIDDFCTGLSALRSLHDLPLDGFKIDRSFVSGGGGKTLANGDIVLMLMSLAQSVGLNVIAEGIETPEQLRRLVEMGCRYGQGYLFAPPMDARAFSLVLEQDARARPTWAHALSSNARATALPTDLRDLALPS